MNRLRLYDLKTSRMPAAVGLCNNDTQGIANYINSAQRRLIMAREAGDTGWWGSWAEIAFNVSRSNPFITLPREVARLARIDVCKNPVMIQNQWYEYLTFGNGKMPSNLQRDCICTVTGYERNSVPTFVDLTSPPQILRLFTTDPSDYQAKRVLLQGLDSNDMPITSQDNNVQVQGIFVTLDQPFVDAPMQFNKITGIQKDITTGSVQLFQVDPTTGNDVLLLTMQPSEKTGWYRRYYLDRLPINCCQVVNQTTPTDQVQVTALAKLDLIPVMVDSDYLLIQNLEAIIEECQSIRYSEIDNETSKKMAQERHIQAIRLLQGELVHYLGKEQPAVFFSPFGSARLEHQRIGVLI